MFNAGQIYKRKELHALYGGQVRAGISTPAKHKLIFIFLSAHGKSHGYKDRWTTDGTLLCPGSGTKGDMEFNAQNKAIRDHQINGKAIHVFQHIEPGNVQYSCQMACIGYSYETEDGLGRQRRIILFELLPVGDDEQSESTKVEYSILKSRTLAQLRQAALATASERATSFERKIQYRERSQAIKLYALKRSHDICAGCNQSAPFKLPGGQPFLEVHHIDKLSDGGVDHPEAVIAVCPNCHRRAHLSADANKFNEYLRKAIKKQEAESLACP